jgi:hypothetical protein
LSLSSQKLRDMFWTSGGFRRQLRYEPDTDPNRQDSECDNPATLPKQGRR